MEHFSEKKSRPRKLLCLVKPLSPRLHLPRLQPTAIFRSPARPLPAAATALLSQAKHGIRVPPHVNTRACGVVGVECSVPSASD